ncbi:MAG: hypothetical protein MR821_05170 [Clostridiales bacterium]|nr:hypothetical protein [Clostridiales bacterium]
MMYGQADFEQNGRQQRRVLTVMLLAGVPLLALAAAGFAMRAEALCIAGCILFGAVEVFLWDWRLAPVRRYGRFLREVTSGLTRRTAGMLMRIGEERVYQDGVWLYELILNVYEDLSEEGERRFLLDCQKPRPDALIGSDVALTSHGSFALAIEPLAQKDA